MIAFLIIVYAGVVLVLKVFRVAEAQLYPAISITGTFGGAASTANGHNLGEVVSSKGITCAAARA